MSSIVSGFEYDIFISYRHNDNRSGWVTDFVNALQEELAATIKEPLTIYFDKNPHDGLLETHHVDKSLEGKLKCLIFIPIISQTYCDTKSFAWQHEFCVFNKLSKEDQFGRDIIVSNGNVTSRILPIKIHDLDVEDKSLLESELGGVLRAIEFIYKEAGVNRPLKSNDGKSDNQNKTDYRNQVNKVANAIKEIITSIKNPVSSSPGTKNRELTNSSTSKKKYVGVGLVALLLLVVTSLFYLKINSSQTIEAIDKSIAVLPFADMSSDNNLEYLGDGIAEEIINVLAQSKDLKVIARSSSFQFKGKNEDLRTMGKMLGVSTILEGSVRKFKDQVRVTAQLINVEDGSHFWSKNFDQNTDNIFVIQDGIAAEVAGALRVTLLEGKTSAHKKPWNEEAQRLYQQGRYFYDRMKDSSAHNLLTRSVAIDSNQAISQLYLSFNSANLGDDAASRLQLDKTFKLDPSLTEAHTAQALKYLFDLKFNKAWIETNIALSNGDNNPVTLRNAARTLQVFGQSAQATTFAKKAVELDPLQTRSWNYLIYNYFYNRNYSEALKIINQVNDPQNTSYIHVLCLLKLNRFKDAEDRIKLIKDSGFRNYMNLLLTILKGDANDTMLSEIENKSRVANEWYRLAIVFGNSGNHDKALNYLSKAIDSKSKNAYTISIDPMLDPLRKNPRFIELLERMNYPKLD